MDPVCPGCAPDRGELPAAGEMPVVPELSGFGEAAAFAGLVAVLPVPPFDAVGLGDAELGVATGLALVAPFCCPIPASQKIKMNAALPISEFIVFIACLARVSTRVRAEHHHVSDANNMPRDITPHLSHISMTSQFAVSSQKKCTASIENAFRRTQCHSYITSERPCI